MWRKTAGRTTDVSRDAFQQIFDLSCKTEIRIEIRSRFGDDSFPTYEVSAYRVDPFGKETLIDEVFDWENLAEAINEVLP